MRTEAPKNQGEIGSEKWVLAEHEQAFALISELHKAFQPIIKEAGNNDLFITTSLHASFPGAEHRALRIGLAVQQKDGFTPLSSGLPIEDHTVAKIHHNLAGLVVLLHKRAVKKIPLNTLGQFLERFRIAGKLMKAGIPPIFMPGDVTHKDKIEAEYSEFLTFVPGKKDGAAWASAENSFFSVDGSIPRYKGAPALQKAPIVTHDSIQDCVNVLAQKVKTFSQRVQEEERQRHIAKASQLSKYET